MIIVLHGENSFLTLRKREEIIAQYNAKHLRGLSLFVFEDDGAVQELKAALEGRSLFEEKKLVVVKDALSALKNDTSFFEWLREKGIQKDKDTVLVFSEREKLDGGKDKNLTWLFAKPTMVQESKKLSPAQLSAWIEKEVSRLGGEIDRDALALLVSSCGDDLWRLASEIAKLISYSKHVTLKNVSSLVARDPEGHIFQALEALSAKDSKVAARHFHALLKQGEDWIKLYGMIVYQFRSLIKIRSLLDEEYEFSQMQRTLQMHPFALQKALPYARRYTKEELMKLYRTLLEMDLALKTGKLSFEAAVENLVLSLRSRTPLRSSTSQ